MFRDSGLRAAALALWVGAWTLIVWAMLSPSPPDLAGQSDKLVHFTGFLVISFAMLGFCRSGGQLLAAGALCLAAAVSLELAQGLVPSRTVEAADMLANIAGVVAGTGASWLGLACLGRRPRPA